MGMFLKMLDYGCLEVSNWVIPSTLIHMTKYLILKKILGLSKTAFDYFVSLTQDSQYENMKAKKIKKWPKSVKFIEKTQLLDQQTR